MVYAPATEAKETTMRSRSLVLTAAFLGTLGGASIASAQGDAILVNPDLFVIKPDQQLLVQPPPGGDAAVNLNRLYLGCTVVPDRQIVIANTTQGTLAQSTVVWFELVDQFTGQHDVEYIYAPALAPGASFEIAMKRVASCTAWLDWQPVFAP